jgi:hypothetical protein
LIRRGFASSAGSFAGLLLSEQTVTATVSDLFIENAAHAAAATRVAATLTERLIRTMSFTKSATIVLLITLGAGLGFVGQQVLQSKQPGADHASKQPEKPRPEAAAAAAAPPEKKLGDKPPSEAARQTELDLYQLDFEMARLQFEAVEASVSGLSLANLKTRIAAFESELSTLELRRIALDSRLQVFNNILKENPKDIDVEGLKLFLKLEPKALGERTPVEYIKPHLSAIQYELTVIETQFKRVEHVLQLDREKAQVQESDDAPT